MWITSSSGCKWRRWTRTRYKSAREGKQLIAIAIYCNIWLQSRLDWSHNPINRLDCIAIQYIYWSAIYLQSVVVIAIFLQSIGKQNLELQIILRNYNRLEREINSCNLSINIAIDCKNVAIVFAIDIAEDCKIRY